MDIASMSDRHSFADWSDTQLLSAALHYGKEALSWRRKFLGTLPEIAKRKLYERHGCGSIVEFAARVGGVSEAQVKNVLSVKEALEETPGLQELLISGAVSVNKLARIVSVVTPENEELLVNQVQLLSQSALETLVRDIKHDRILLRAQKLTLPTIEEITQVAVTLDRDVAAELEELKEKGIDVNEFLRSVLAGRREEIEQEKERIASELVAKRQESSRHIPTKVQKILKKEHGTKCAKDGCNKSATENHHQKRWGVDPTHDPRYISPFCSQHHEIAHAIDVKVQERRQR